MTTPEAIARSAREVWAHDCTCAPLSGQRHHWWSITCGAAAQASRRAPLVVPLATSDGSALWAQHGLAILHDVTAVQCMEDVTW